MVRVEKEKSISNQKGASLKNLGRLKKMNQPLTSSKTNAHCMRSDALNARPFERHYNDMIRFSFILILLFLSSCTTKLDLTEVTIKENIVGQWVESKNAHSFGTETLIFNEDGSGHFSTGHTSLGKSSADFKYEINGNAIKVIMEDPVDHFTLIPYAPQYKILRHTKKRMKVKTNNHEKNQVFYKKTL